jgi:DNA repair exonuclease SbcCD ATPase subunit
VVRDSPAVRKRLERIEKRLGEVEARPQTLSLVHDLEVQFASRLEESSEEVSSFEERLNRVEQTLDGQTDSSAVEDPTAEVGAPPGSYLVESPILHVSLQIAHVAGDLRDLRDDLEELRSRLDYLGKSPALPPTPSRVRRVTRSLIRGRKENEKP